MPGNPGNSFMARLRIRELTEEDSGLTHNLTITNTMGSTSYLIRLHDITGEWWPVILGEIRFTICELFQSLSDSQMVLI